MRVRGRGGGGEDLLADADVLLADEHASVVDALEEGVRWRCGGGACG